MQPGEESSSKVKFECQLCGFTAPYSYYGQKPPNSRSIVFLEECFIMKDPFTPEKGKFLILGSHCSLCNKITCVNGNVPVLSVDDHGGFSVLQKILGNVAVEIPKPLGLQPL
ncbi:cysteine-rich DPF motif domain-containing protein 1 isoform X2 [Protopterus annectens]|uniref:cysteine-rich DPF motif domain-containing protein 1 isoform X2 n=1 Tax=Protopterus annectens TaxID=7888 RepID=UPI001CFB0B20|nr:cysteine-rich DPF motif domain-containing protein 1 isoform X2 [Protopterus annectens]